MKSALKVRGLHYTVVGRQPTRPGNIRHQNQFSYHHPVLTGGTRTNPSFTDFHHETPT